MFASTYIASGRKQGTFHSSPLDINSGSAASYSPWSTPELSVQYDDRGRLQPFVETAEQRRARMEFLRKRESSRRISAWLEDSSKSDSSDSDRRSNSLRLASSYTDSLHTIDEDDEAENEVIYSTSPSNPRWGLQLPSTTTAGRTQSRHLRASSRTSSFSSLSSISEEEA